MDQTLFAGSNFLLHILLAKWLAEEDYGAFSLAFTIFLLFAAVHTAVLTEPMLIFGAGRYREEFAGYARVVFRIHWCATGVLAAGVALAGLVTSMLGSAKLSQTLLGLAASLPLVLALWLVRKAFYVQSRTGWAALGSGVYAFLLLSGLIILRHSERLNVASAFLVTGFSSLVPAIILKGCLLRGVVARTHSLASVASEHWSFGRWNTLATFAQWSSGQILMVLVPVALGLKAAATLAAVVNLYRPLNPITQSLTSMVLPEASHRFQNGLARGSARLVWGIVLVLAGVVAAYGIVVFLFSESLIRMLYGGRYLEGASLTLLFAVSYTASTTVQAFTIVLKVTGRISSVVIVWTLPALLIAVLSVPAMQAQGLSGAMMLVAASYSLAGAAAAWMVWRSPAPERFAARGSGPSNGAGVPLE